MAVTRSLRGVMDNWGMVLGAKGDWIAGAAEPRDLSLALQLLITTGQAPGGLSPTRSASNPFTEAPPPRIAGAAARLGGVWSLSRSPRQESKGLGEAGWQATHSLC